MGIAGLPVPDSGAIDGRNLAQSVRGRAPAPELDAYSHTSVIPDSVYAKMLEPGGADTWGARMKLYPQPDIRFSEVAVRRGSLVFKLRNDGNRLEIAAFDRSVDPSETVNVYDPDDARHRQIAANLRRYKTRLVESVSENPANMAPDPQEAEKQLRALGYLQ